MFTCFDVRTPLPIDVREYYTLFSRCLDISCAKEQIKSFKDVQNATRCWVQGFRSSEEEKEPTNAAAEPNGSHSRGQND